MRRLLALGAALFCLFAGPAAAATTRTVTVGDTAFTPAYLRVEPGDTVVWRNAGRAPHSVASRTGVFDSGRLLPGQTFTQTFPRPGRFGYQDRLVAKPATGVVQVGPDRDRPRLTGLSVRSSATRLRMSVTLSEDVSLRVTLRSGKRHEAVRTRRLTEGVLRYTYRFGRGTTLKPGRYRLSLVGTDVAGNRSRSVSAAFRVR